MQSQCTIECFIVFFIQSLLNRLRIIPSRCKSEEVHGARLITKIVKSPMGCEPLIRAAQVADPDAIVRRGCTEIPVDKQGIRVLGTPLGQPEFCGGTVEGGFPVACLPYPGSARFAVCLVAPAFLYVDQSKLSAESSASSPLGRICSCPRHQSVGILFRVAGSSSRRSTQEHCAPSFPSWRVGPGQCRSLQVSSILGQLGRLPPNGQGSPPSHRRRVAPCFR